MTAPRLRHHPDAVVQRLDGQLLVLLPGDSAFLHLDETASSAWDLLAEPLTAQELSDALSELYDVDPVGVARDLAPALALLVQHGLVVPVDAS